MRAVRGLGRMLIDGDENAVNGLGLAAVRSVGVTQREMSVILGKNLAARQANIAFLRVALDGGKCRRYSRGIPSDWPLTLTMPFLVMRT